MIKRPWLLLILVIAVSFNVRADVYTHDVQDNHYAVYNVIDAAGDHVASQTVNVSIQRVSDGYWFDFNDSTFKNSGWTSKVEAMTEDATNELYTHSWNPPASETGAEQYRYCVKNADATYGDRQCDSLVYLDAADFKADVSNLDAAVSSRSSHAAADVWSVGTRTITGGTVDTNNDKTGYSLSAAGVDAFFDEAISGHTTVGTFGKVFSDEVSGLRAYGDSGWATATGFSTHSAADAATQVWAAGTRTLTALDEDSTTIDLDSSNFGGLSTAGLAAFFTSNSGTTYASAVAGSVVKEIADNAGGSGLTAAGIADAVWEELIADHSGVSGSVAESLSNASAASNPLAVTIESVCADYSGKVGQMICRIYRTRR